MLVTLRRRDRHVLQIENLLLGGSDPASAAHFSHNELFIPAPCAFVFA